MKQLLSISALGLCVLLQGCVNQEIGGTRAEQVRNFVERIEPSLRPASSAACAFGLSLIKDPQEKNAVQKSLSVVAGVVTAAKPDQTAGQLSKAIQAAMPVSEQRQLIADSIAGGFGIALPYIKGDAQLFLKVVSDIAAGVNDVAGMAITPVQ